MGSKRLGSAVMFFLDFHWRICPILCSFLPSPSHRDFLPLVSSRGRSSSYSPASLCSAFTQSSPHTATFFRPSPLPLRERQSTAEFTRPSSASHLSLNATPDKPSQTRRLSLPLMTLAHLPVSLVLLAALFLLLAVSGR